jgi:hypothetical protein
MKKEFFPPRPSANPTIYTYELVGKNNPKNPVNPAQDE